LKFSRTIGPSKWEEHFFKSQRPLRGEIQPTLANAYEYLVLCRWSAHHVLIIGESLSVVDELLKFEAGANQGKSRFHRVSIGVADLVRNLTATPRGPYVLTRVDARTPSFADPLKSVTFYGMNISEASFFREHLNEFRPYSCGLRDLGGASEIVRLSNKGTVSFQYTGARMTRDIEKVLNFLHLGEYFKASMFPDD
jgi:hypothetical protein